MHEEGAAVSDSGEQCHRLLILMARMERGFSASRIFSVSARV